ncbi:MAG: hypothetical protein RL398_3113 [Planctomycetota bacterium]
MRAAYPDRRGEELAECPRLCDDARMLARAASLLALLPAMLAAQAPELVLQNLAPFARREVVAVAVPFAQGAVQSLPALHVDGCPTAWEPFGARWPDGSLRVALCLFEAEIEPLRELRVALRDGAGPALPDGDVPMPTGKIEFVAKRGGKAFRVEPQRVADLERNPLRRVELRRARLPELGLVCELHVRAGRGQPHAYVELATFFSDPTTAAMQVDLDELAVETDGVALFCHHAARLAVRQSLLPNGSRAELLRGTSLGDGQGLRRVGALCPPLAADGSLRDDTLKAASLAPLLGAADWRASGAFGAFGVVPEPPPWLAGDRLRAHLAARHRAYVEAPPVDDPFAQGPLGLAKFAGQTGDQFDFGVVKLSAVAASGLPSMLFEAEASVLQEACRPVHFYEADGSPVDPAKRPDWIVWSGRTHWHGEVSKDRLGKPAEPPKFEAHGWTGKDRQHWSSNHLGAFALLTGSHWARAELANEARLYLAGQTVDPAKSTSGPGAPRGAGRTLHAATWAYLATGDGRLLERMQQRLDRVHLPGWPTRELASDRVRPFAVNKPDPRMLDGKNAYWNPWQDAIAATGFAAAYRITGNAAARELAEGLAQNVVRHGWRVDERCMVALAMRWHDGEPIPAAAFGDRGEVQWPDSSGFAEWALPAVEIARVAAEAAGDTALAARAEEIQRRVRSNRRQPPFRAPEFGGYDRQAEWDAVRWLPR